MMAGQERERDARRRMERGRRLCCVRTKCLVGTSATQRLGNALVDL